MPDEVRRLGEAARERDRIGVALLGHPVDPGSARERQAEQPGHLVEGLPCSIVQGLAERDDGRCIVRDKQQRGVPARDEQADDRIRELAMLKLVDHDVADEVIDAVYGHAQADAQRLGGRHADEQGTDEARSRRHGDRVDVGQPDAGGDDGAVQRGDDRLQVRAARDLRHDSAEAGMLSTLEAISFASRTRPRTRPIPVSSHEVSIPRTSGCMQLRVPDRHAAPVCGTVGERSGTDGQSARTCRFSCPFVPA